MLANIRKSSGISYKIYGLLKSNISESEKKAYFFGSYAKGNVKADSDMDVVFIFQDIGNTFDMQVRLMKLRRGFDTKIEAHVFNERDFGGFHPLVCEILKTGFEIL